MKVLFSTNVSYTTLGNTFIVLNIDASIFGERKGSLVKPTRRVRVRRKGEWEDEECGRRGGERKGDVKKDVKKGE